MIHKYKYKSNSYLPRRVKAGFLHPGSSKIGFTLMEVILTTAISSIFIVGLVSLNRLFGDSQKILTLSSQSFNEANIGTNAMVREIRNAAFADNGAYPLELADDQQIIFYANLDDDPQIERIRYYLENGQLNRGVIQPTGSLSVYLPANEQINLVIDYVQNQTNPIFYYYNGDWPTDVINNPLPAPTRLVETKLIQIILTINPQPTRPESQYTIQSFAQIRNLKTNL